MNRLIVFTLRGERFAMPAAEVAEVVSRFTVAPLAGLPAYLAGVVHHRGAWLAAVDPAAVLGLGASTRSGHALIMRRGRLRYALLVDETDGILAAGDVTIREFGGAEVLVDGMGVVTLIAPDELFKNGLPPGWEETMSETRTEPVQTDAPLVVFKVGGSEFGVSVREVLEVLDYQPPRKVPRAPAFLDGIIDLRGGVAPVVDLRRRFELPDATVDEDTKIVVVAREEDRIGLVVDTVSEVLRLPAGSMSEPPAYFRGLAAEYLGGIARAGERLIIVLNVGSILTSEERLQLQEADLETDDAGEE